MRARLSSDGSYPYHRQPCRSRQPTKAKLATEGDRNDQHGTALTMMDNATQGDGRGESRDSLRHGDWKRGWTRLASYMHHTVEWSGVWRSTVCTDSGKRNSTTTGHKDEDRHAMRPLRWEHWLINHTNYVSVPVPSMVVHMCALCSCR
jgi:hypothetical protein